MILKNISNIEFFYVTCFTISIFFIGVPICYVGGPVWAMAWAPIPALVTEQYLAVSTLQHMNHLVEINESVSFSSMIQFWKFSSIDNIRYV